MWSERLQKTTSFFLIFFLLFSFTLRIPFVAFFSSSVYATDDEFFNLVSIIVDEDTYDEVRSKLVRYSRDIQATLENTRVVILPTPSDASVRDIASLNESLYFEGYKAHKDVDFESRLIGTVLVGKIPVPIVFDGGNSSKSVLPYVDFEEKSYSFDHEAEKYQKSDKAPSSITPEVWHGVISPNTGEQSTDITAIQDYFDKNHDFYTGNGVFDQNTGVIDGKNTPASSDYEPYVFYYDQFRENQAIQYQKYIGYQMYLQNIEDITYNRYSKELAEKIKDQVLGIQEYEISELMNKVDPDFDISGITNGPDTEMSSDIATRYITDNSTKRFLEIFNGSTLGDMRKHVFNAGRYNEGGPQVNVDMPPFLISVLDEVSAQVIKNVNSALEEDIIDLVENGLSRDIAIPVSTSNVWAPNPYATAGPYYINVPSGPDGTVTQTVGTRPKSTAQISCDTTSTGFYYGKPSVNITNAAECTIRRGSNSDSGTLVEANRGYNVSNTQEDTQLCGRGMKYDADAGKITDGITGFWGGNTPVNLTQKGSNYSDFQLGDHNLRSSIRPLHDNVGMKEVSDNTKVPSPLDCYEDISMIRTYEEVPWEKNTRDDTIWYCDMRFNLPVQEGDDITYYNPVGTSSHPNTGRYPAGSSHESRYCAADNIITPQLDFETLYLNGVVPPFCSVATFSFEGTAVGAAIAHPSVYQTSGGQDGHLTCIDVATTNYDFKKISSYITHRSPTSEEFGDQVRSVYTPSLPIDTTRYIDFIGANGSGSDRGYQRIDFPQLFDVVSTEEKIDLEIIAEKTKTYLDGVSAEINSTIRSARPNTLGGKNLELYNLLKTGEYPNDDIDLYQDLIDKPLEVFTSDNQSKEISYFETLVFAIYWNNLKTVSSKYKFVFEEYLSNQFTGNAYNFHLPKSKKSYEVAYFGAPGDAQNMYVKLDPEGKSVHPYASTISKNIELQSTVQVSSVASPTNNPEGAFACAPPEGVPIWEWIPAVTCWLSDMLPPTIGISEGSCGSDHFSLSQEESEVLRACQGDLNKNGVNDCLESKLSAGSLELVSDAGKYYYNSSGVLTAKIYDSEGEFVSFDNASYIGTELTRVEVPENSSEPFTGSNIRVIYDINDATLNSDNARENAEKYVRFSDTYTRAQRGEAKAYFSTLGEDANVYFDSYIETEDSVGDTLIDLLSNELKVEVRGDRVFLNSSIISKDGDVQGGNTIITSEGENFYLAANFEASESEINLLNSSSLASEKVIFQVNNYSPAGNILPMNYPLRLEVEKQGEIIYSESDITQSDITSPLAFFDVRESGEYTVRVVDADGFKSHKIVEVIPEAASSITPTISTSVAETEGNLSTHLFTILDRFSNPATSDVYQVDISIDGGGLVFEANGESEISYQVLEGYKAFRLRTTNKTANNTIRFILKNLEGDVIAQSEKSLQTVEDIRLEVNPPAITPVVGGESYPYQLRFTDSSGSLLSGLYSRAYLGVNSLYGSPEKAYVEIIGGVGEVKFQSSELAGEDIKLEFQLEGGNDIYSYQIDVLPGDAVKIDLALSRDRIEASTDSKTTLEAILKDRYNNTVFNDSTTELSLEIPDENKAIITTPISTRVVESGKAQFQIQATDIPGIGYFKIDSSPNIGENTFNIEAQSPFEKIELSIPTMTAADGTLTDTGKQFFREFSEGEYISMFPTRLALKYSDVYENLPAVLQEQLLDFWNTQNIQTFQGSGEAAASVETFFFWDKESIEGNSYNSLYTVLFGAPYGDISQENYLAGSLLFDRYNSSLTVSSLLESPYKFHDILSLGKDASLERIGGGDITQDIDIGVSTDIDGRLTLELYNAALDAYIGKLYYNLSQDTDIRLSVDDEYLSSESAGNVIIKNSVGKTIFRVDSDGRFDRKSGTSLKYDPDYIGKGLMLKIYSGDAYIGKVLIDGDLDINITRDSNILKNKLSTLDNTIIAHLESNQYASREVFSDNNSSQYKIYYKDPFANKYALNDFYSNDNLGLESGYSEEGIGWQNSNTMLLSFAAGESVGAATKHFQSFSLINLGDPVVSLKALETSFVNTSEVKSFDSTLGELITDSNDIQSYKLFDYNNNGEQDLITIHRDGSMKLFEKRNISGRYIPLGELTYSPDLGPSRLIQTGDFSGDGYDDIFFVSDGGRPYIFINNEKDLIRYDVASQFDLPGSIIQSESYDMDNDGIDDIITLDDSGGIHIFYGGGSSLSPEFSKLSVGNSFGVTLSEVTLAHGGAVYYDGLEQIDPSDASNARKNSDEYIAELRTANEDGEDNPFPDFIDEALVNQFLYVTLPYLPGESPTDSSNTNSDEVLSRFENDVAEIGGSLEAEGLSESVQDLRDFESRYGAYTSYDSYENNSSSLTYFLRSEYADTAGLEITKTYTDRNGEYLQSGDRVYLDISIENISGELISEIAYVDSLPKYFAFENDEYITLGSGAENRDRNKSLGNYNIVVEDFTLAPGEEKLLRFEIKSLPISYGDLQIGLHEEGELGDDTYGDIILKEENTNCGAVADIYRSTAARSYQEGTTTPSCDISDIDIGNTFPQLEDSDGDGVPDYLQNLLSAQSSVGDIEGNFDANTDEEDIDAHDQDLQENQSLQTVLENGRNTRNQQNIDTDNDGIPDSDDSMDGTDDAIDFMGALSQIDQKAEEISEEVDTLIEGLSCGFGGGSCIATPLNWAPLAPGSDPTIFGMPVGDGLKVGEGIPVFSALTGRQTMCGKVPCCVPSVFPAHSQAFVPGPACGPSSAGGSLGTWAPTNFVRIFVTPTLTGGVGTAVCFGGPAIVAGNSNPPGIHPIAPGGNCIVAAQPLLGCEGGEGDPSVLGYPITSEDFSVIHANCDGETSAPYTPASIQEAFVKDYLQYQRTGVEPEGLYDKFIEAFEEVSQNGAGNYQTSSEPLIGIGNDKEALMSSLVSFDTEALAAGNLEDVVQIQNMRIAGFPGFIMDWVERQLDEITSKLTNLPKIFVILPDFGGIFDYSLGDFGSELDEAFESGKSKNQTERDQVDGELEALQLQKESLDCSDGDELLCLSIDARIAVAQKIDSGQETYSGIKEVYEFLGSIPLVNIETEVIDVNVPWIASGELERFIIDWENTAREWEQEVQDFSNHIASLPVSVGGSGLEGICASYVAEGGVSIDSDGNIAAGASIEVDVEESIANCVAQYTNLNEEAEALIASLEANIEILEEYKEFPKQLSKIISKKIDWLEQILCNVEAISEFLGGWISSNGERFKAWVELYILIKAILKSWQIFIDIFNGYDAECHECKNERQDLQNFFFGLIGSILPSAPIIEFPKWPDIIIDLHNIRAGMTVYMPDFEVNFRPIVLPTLPDLTLPRPQFDVAVSLEGDYFKEFDLPELPLLPQFAFPELPDLPSLPTVELPNLPPPPTIPKLFGAVEGMMNIAKLVTKVMCILKSSPFVPEWRAGDQIAFITERNGYLPTDFINIQSPSFSYSAISAIEVSTYVNFEFEMEFIIEAVESIMAPIDSITNNVVNMFNIETPDLEVPNPLPSRLDIEIGPDGVTDELSLAPLHKNPNGINFLAALIVIKSRELLVYLSDNSHTTLSNAEFKRYVGTQLASHSISSNLRTTQLQNMWSDVFSMTYSKEDTFIEELLQSNREKFQTLQDILQTEIEYSKLQEKDLENTEAPSYINKVSLDQNTIDSRVAGYNEALKEFNKDTLNAAITLVSGESSETKEFRKSIQEDGAAIMSHVRGGLESYKQNTLLTATPNPNGTPSPSTGATGGSCVASGAYNYTYQGIYVMEDGKNYKLFDYTDILRGEETPTIIDIDNDGDDDVLYLVGGKLYFKENRKTTGSSNHISGPPLILSADDNRYYNGDIYYESIDGLVEIGSSDGAINIEFAKPKQEGLNSFSVEYHTVIDRFVEPGDTFVPEEVQTHIVDALDRGNTQDKIGEEGYIILPNIATLEYAGAMNGLSLYTPELKNIREDLLDNTEVTLTADTAIYAGSTDFSVSYTLRGGELQTQVVRAGTHLMFDNPIIITELEGDAYVSLDVETSFKNTDVLDFIGKPILPGSRIEFSGNIDLLDESSHIDIRYDDTTLRQFDIRDISSYQLYDLGRSYGDEYRVRLESENDFYYARIRTFSEGIYGTQSKQVILSPQKEGDDIAPQIGYSQTLRVPVYQTEVLDLTSYVYEDGGLGDIEDVFVDFDLTVDSDDDGNYSNDRDSDGIEIEKTVARLTLSFGPYEQEMSKDILLSLTDDNGNVATRKFRFEVYTPEPSIQTVDENTVTGNLSEGLAGSPVSLYRYRGGVLEKLESSDGTDIFLTDIEGSYSYEAPSSSSGLILEHAGNPIAGIGELSGRIDLTDVLASITVKPSNDPDNTSVYPELQILHTGVPIYRQFIKVPEQEVSQVVDFTYIDETGMYLKLIDQERYASYRVPLGVPYNPGSVSVYLSSDSDKTPVMTVMQDGRVNIDTTRYRLEYRTVGDDSSLILIQKGTNDEIAQLVYHLEASYILR